MFHSKVPRTATRFCKELGIYDLLIILVIFSYLFYAGNLVSFRDYINVNTTTTTKQPPTLFSIPKRVFLRSTVAAVISSSKLTNPNKKCLVTIAIILCQDDRYLAVKNKTSVHFNSSSMYPVHHHSLPANEIVAKDFSRQINQTLVLLKSIAILSKYESAGRSSNCVEVLLLSDNPLKHYKEISTEIKTKWSPDFQQLIKLTNIPVRYPPGYNWMRKMFRPCATLRLFLAELLPETWNSIIYLDTDVIFFQSVQALWAQFKRFHDVDGNKKVAAMAPCLFHYGTNANSVPFYGTSGLNAGVMLMNLTRMRGSQWTNKIRMVTTMFQDKIKLADQDILNIYFHFFPEELHVLTCDWNFRPFQCREGNTCEDSEIGQGISVLHGNALSFTPQGPEPLFHSIFQAFHRVKLDSAFKLGRFVEQLESSLLKTEEKTRMHYSQCKQFGGLDVLLLNRLYEIVER